MGQQPVTKKHLAHSAKAGIPLRYSNKTSSANHTLLIRRMPLSTHPAPKWTMSLLLPNPTPLLAFGLQVQCTPVPFRLANSKQGVQIDDFKGFSLCHAAWLPSAYCANR